MHRGPCLLLVAFLALFSECCGACNSSLPENPNEMEMFRYLTDPCRYDKDNRPETPFGIPLDVTQRIFIYYIKAHYSANEMDMMMLLELRWVDERLKYSHLTDSLNLIMRGRVVFLNAVWIPHTYVTNDKATKVTGLVSKDSYINILPSGLVVFTVRLRTSVKCKPSHIEWFPFDHQLCELLINNWRYDLRHLRSHWALENAVTHKNELSPINFYLKNIETYSGLESYINPNEDCQTSCKYNHSSSKVTFKFVRQAGFYMVDFYFPSIIIVMISWVSFWMAPESAPGRCILGTGSIIAFLLLSWSGSPIPKTATFKVNDMWEISCTMFILASLYEFALVNMIDRRKSKHVKLKKKSVKYIMKYSMSPKFEKKLNLGGRRLSVSCPTSPEFQRKILPILNETSTMKKLKELREKDFTSTPSKRIGRHHLKDRMSELMTPMISGGPQIIIEEDEEENDTKPSAEQQHTFFTMTPQEIARWIDTKSRYVFPIAFAIFNLFYWSFLWIPQSLMEE